jgi:2-dehydropantoate 2-reductase
VTDDIALERWKKLLWNLPFNPVSVLGGGLDSKELCDGADIEQLCSTLMDEVISVANACGVPLDRSMAEAQLEYTRNFPAYKTSMLQDFEAGRPLEVDAIIGNVLKLAVSHDIEVPVIRCCAALLYSMNRKNLEK